MKKKICLLFYLTCLAKLCFAQSYEQDSNTTDYSIETFGSIAKNDYTPFWIVSNRYGVVPLEAGNGYLRIGAFHHQVFKNQIRWGAGLDVVASAPRQRYVYVQQIYTEIGYKCLNLFIGSKENYISLWDKELSSGDLVLSSNARPIPEINLSIPRFTAVPWTKGILQFKGNFAVGRSFDTHYLRDFNGDRQDEYIKKVLWHHKSVYIRVLDPKNNFPVTAIVGLRHHAQWGGLSTNPDNGVQPHSLKDFVRILLGQSGGKDATPTDRKNALGNHYGSYDIKFGYLNPQFDVHFYIQHFFDDASGIELYNFVDNLYGLQFHFPSCPLANKLVIEYLYAKNQSGPVHNIFYDREQYSGYGGGNDDYYNNVEYTTGVSYFNRNLGTPLITSPEYNKDRKFGFKNNRVIAWHIGLTGYLSKQVAYRLLTTNSENWGIPDHPFLKKKNNFSGAAKLSYCHPRRAVWLFSGEIATDLGSLFNNQFGMSLSVKKTGILKKN
jgi:hypothetical protein